MKKLLFGLILLVPNLLSAQQVGRNLTAANGELVGFYEFKPSDYNSNPSAKYPLIINLHGIGERGDGTTTLSNLLGVGIAHYINMGATMRFTVNGQTQSFLVLSPQLSFNYGNWQNFYIDEMLNYAKNNLRVDLNRIYLTGYSLGGGGVWHYASTSPANASQFAAIVPVCGTCDWSNLCNITSSRVAVWAFHAMDDGTVSVACTQSAINGLNSCGPQIAPQATYYPNGNHWIWDKAYDTTHSLQSPLNVFEWMLTQSRNGSSTPPPPTGGVTPVAVVGADQAINLPTSASNLTGSGSYAVGGTISSYNWTQVGGPSSASINSGSTANTGVSNLVSGVYTFQLKVTSNTGTTSTANEKVTVNGSTSNLPPIAKAGGNQTITSNSVNLSAWGSTDPDGFITSYNWTQVSGPSQATITNGIYSTPSMSNLVSGTYAFVLTVTDNQGAIGRDTAYITVNVGGSPPPPSSFTVNAGANQTLDLSKNATLLSGSATATVTSWSWTEVSGPSQYALSNPNTQSPWLSNLVQGVYIFKLTATNTSGATASAQVQITVGSGTPPPPPVSWNKPPIAVAGSDQTITSTSLQLSSWGSYDPDGSIVAYKWQKIAGPASFAIVNDLYATPTISNLVSGTYTIQLTVTDNQGATGTATVNITVNTGSPAPVSGGPVAVPGYDAIVTLPWTTDNYLIGSGSYDPTGAYITSYTWSQVSGPGQATMNWLSNTNVEAANLVHGVYLFKLTVTNSNGVSNSATKQVTVN